MFRTALLVLSGNAATSLLLLARNLLVARMIPLADYGVAATFALMMAVVEMASTFGLQQQIIQSRHGDDPHFQAALQGFQLIRGVIAGVVMLLIAGPMARFLGIPEVIWAYQFLAIVPVLNAMQHFDIHRMNRQMVFAPMLLTGALPALLSTLAVWPLAIWFDDWQILLYAILLQASLGTLVSHLTAERPWRLAYDPAIIAESLRFGWPLLANAILMFLIFQGDKMIVGRELGMETLAIFAMGVTLTLTPTLVMSKTVQNLMLPKLSAASDVGEFQRLAVICFQVHAILASVLVLVTALVGEWFIDALLGSKYQLLGLLLVWFSVQQGLRICKGGPSIVALSKARTENALWANMVRILFMPLVWYLVANGGSLLSVLSVGICGETVGLILAVWLQHSRLKVPLRPIVLTLCFVFAGMAAATAALLVSDPWILISAAFVCSCSAILFAPDLVQTVTNQFKRRT
jgi:O-antigen/teichoic acid export membrane protein